MLLVPRATSGARKRKEEREKNNIVVSSASRLTSAVSDERALGSSLASVGRKSANWIILGRSCPGKKSGMGEWVASDMPAGDGGGGGLTRSPLSSPWLREETKERRSRGLLPGAASLALRLQRLGVLLRPFCRGDSLCADGLIFLMRGTADSRLTLARSLACLLPSDPADPRKKTFIPAERYCSGGKRRHYCRR